MDGEHATAQRECVIDPIVMNICCTGFLADPNTAAELQGNLYAITCQLLIACFDTMARGTLFRYYFLSLRDYRLFVHSHGELYFRAQYSCRTCRYYIHKS